MGLIIDEQRMIEENTFAYEKRIQSPTNRLIDTKQTYTTYYHILHDQTTVDEGFLDVASIIGHRSPIRFSKIENFPIYGIDQVVLSLQDEEQGLDSNYQSEGIILPNTIKPEQNDFFIIPVLHDYYVFRVINIQYDTVMPDNYYKIEFQLEYIDSVKLEEIEKQVVEDYTCILENIGSENKCIVEKETYKKIREIESMYRKILDFYMAMFYNERHNVFMYEDENGRFLYDPMQAEFINHNRLFQEKRNLEAFILTDQIDDPKLKYTYIKSVYKLIELKDLRLLKNFYYRIRPGVSIHESSFYRWHEKKVDVMVPPLNEDYNLPKIFSDEFVFAIRDNSKVNSEYAELIKKHIRGENLELKDIPMDLDDELVHLNNNIEVFFFTPMIMYIIRDIIKKEF